MATAEELLGTSGTVDKTLVIDSDLRMINIPSSVKNLGVESDDEVLKLNFRMPSSYCGIDLSTFRIRINYLNAQGEGDVYEVVDAVKLASGYITFSWTVGRHAAMYKGDVRFNVCLKETNSDSIVTREFNTTIATLPILEGLETSEQVVTEYTDIIEQWRQMLFGVGDTEEERIRQASQEEQENITQKGIEVLSTIPEDYATTFGMIDNADRTKADAIVCSSEGEIISVHDSSDDHLRGLRIFGKTTQVTTTGKNLFDLESALSNQKRGTTSVSDYVYYKNGVRINSNSHDHGRAYMYLTLDAGTYNLSANVKVKGSWNFSIKNYDTDTELVNSSTSTDGYISYFFTIDETALIGFCFMSTVSGGPQTIVTDIQLELGTEATSYEPYSGGYESPSPYYRQDLTSIDNFDVSISGLNLLPYPYTSVSQTLHGITYVVNEDGSVKSEGTTTQGTNFFFAQNMTLPKGKYLLWRKGDLSGGTLMAYNGVEILAQVSNNDTFSTIEITEADETFNVYLNIPYEGTSLSGTIYPMITSETTESVDFESYKDAQTISAAYVLNGIPVESGGNYTDMNGQQWICDEVDFERGIYVKRVNTAVLDGTENISIEDRTGGTYIFVIRFSDPVKAQYVYNGLCTHMSYGPEPIGLNEKDKVMCIWTTGNAYCRYDAATNVDEMVEWLSGQYEAGTPVTIKYIMATPIETSLTAEEIEAFKALYSNFHNTTVTNNSNATMLLKYNADTKTYLDRLPKATDKQVSAAVDAWLTANFTSAEGVSF